MRDIHKHLWKLPIPEYDGGMPCTRTYRTPAQQQTAHPANSPASATSAATM